ncbi:hypothetical protein CDD82_1765 [Ophiocordyceps australis]|uniref:FeS cluster biogenesis domain-containing protein n=1 Tax=Ophiocordyceps australis TaxID=1399860 RepID=A0A2C5XXJ0_9HYPO|nr:hypothetical protein CDD82_1765 [Ophiocordyceps australis]
MASLHCAAPSAARSFIILARRLPSAAPLQSCHHFDFLAPRAAAAPRCSIDSPRRPLARSALSSPCGAAAALQRPPSFKRHFASSVSLRATRCVLNPQTDQNGNELLLEITPRAAHRLYEIMKKDANPNLALRIQVESGGCHGFQYLMSLITLPHNPPDPDNSNSNSSVVSPDDSIFQYFPGDSVDSADEDAIPLPNAPKIILDEPSLDLLKGSKVDFTRELIGSQFKVVDNPLATSSCGCGTSFDIKM